MRAVSESSGSFFLQDRAHGVGGAFSMERALARNHLVENCAEGKNVRTMIGRFASHLFRRHVSGRAHDHAGFSGDLDGGRVSAAVRRFRARQLGQSEVKNLHPAVAGEKKILRLQVAMHDALLVRRSKSLGHLDRVVDDSSHRQRAVAQPLAQGLAFQQF